MTQFFSNRQAKFLSNPNLEEDTELQGLGKTLKATSPAKEKASVDAKPAESSAQPEGTPKPTAKWAVDQLVKPVQGPHKGKVHTVVQVYPNGDILIEPKDLPKEQVSYRNGKVKAKANQVEFAESLTKESLFKTIVRDTQSIVEAKTKRV